MNLTNLVRLETWAAETSYEIVVVVIFSRVHATQKVIMSVRRSVGRSVRRLVGNAFFLNRKNDGFS